MKLRIWALCFMGVAGSAFVASSRKPVPEAATASDPAPQSASALLQRRLADQRYGIRFRAVGDAQNPFIDAIREGRGPHFPRFMGFLGISGGAEHLLKALESGDRGVRLQAAQSAGLLGDAGMSAALLEILRSDIHADVRLAALGALGELDTGDLRQGVSEARLDPDHRVRAESARLLAKSVREGRRVGSDGEWLLGLLDDTSVVVRRAALAGLEDMGCVRALPVAALVERMGSDDDPWVRAAAARALGNGPGEGDVVVREALTEALGDSDGRVRRHTVLALGKLLREPDAATLERLRRMAEADEDPLARADAIRAMGFMGPGTIIGPIVAVFSSDPDRNVRIAVCETIGDLAFAGGADIVSAGLGDADGDVRWVAADAAGALGNVRAAPPLERLLRDPYWRVRESAARALGATGSLGSVAPLLQAMTSRSNLAFRFVRREAAESVGRLAAAGGEPDAGWADARRALEQTGIEDPDSTVREAASWALAQIPTGGS